MGHRQLTSQTNDISLGQLASPARTDPTVAANAALGTIIDLLSSGPGSASKRPPVCSSGESSVRFSMPNLIEPTAREGASQALG